MCCCAAVLMVEVLLKSVGNRVFDLFYPYHTMYSFLFCYHFWFLFNQTILLEMFLSLAISAKVNQGGPCLPFHHNTKACLETRYNLVCHFACSVLGSFKKSVLYASLVCVFYFSLSFIGFTYFLLLSIPPLPTRIVPLRFQARGRRSDRTWV